MFVSWKYKIMVNFICHNFYLVFQTKSNETLQFVLCPDASAWIVRSAENQQLHLFFCKLFFDFVEIHIKTVVFPQCQRIFNQFSSVADYRIFERVVNRLHNHNRILWLGQSFDSNGNSADNTGCAHEPFFFWRPVVPFRHPVYYGMVVVLLWTGISENTESPGLFYSLANFVGRAEIHICYPKRQNILRNMVFFFESMLD